MLLQLFLCDRNTVWSLYPESVGVILSNISYFNIWSFINCQKLFKCENGFMRKLYHLYGIIYFAQSQHCLKSSSCWRLGNALSVILYFNIYVIIFHIGTRNGRKKIDIIELYTVSVICYYGHALVHHIQYLRSSSYENVPVCIVCAACRSHFNHPRRKQPRDKNHLSQIERRTTAPLSAAHYRRMNNWVIIRPSQITPALLRCLRWSPITGSLAMPRLSPCDHGSLVSEHDSYKVPREFFSCQPLGLARRGEVRRREARRSERF